MSIEDTILSLEPLIYAPHARTPTNLGTLGGDFRGTYGYQRILDIEYPSHKPFSMTQHTTLNTTQDAMSLMGTQRTRVTYYSSPRTFRIIRGTASGGIAQRYPGEIPRAPLSAALVFDGRSIQAFINGVGVWTLDAYYHVDSMSTHYQTGSYLNRYTHNTFFDRALTHEEVMACHNGSLELPFRDEDDNPLGVVGYSPGPGAMLEPVQIEMT